MDKIHLLFGNFFLIFPDEEVSGMIKFGQVTAYDEAEGKATITYIRPEACAKCGGCGSMSQTGSIELKADCKVGDWVKVSLPDGRFMTATLLAYVIPLIGFLAGLFLGYSLSGQNELWAVAGAMIGLAICALGLRINEKRIAGKPEWTPHVAAVYDHRPDLDDLGCHSAE